MSTEAHYVQIVDKDGNPVYWNNDSELYFIGPDGQKYKHVIKEGGDGQTKWVTSTFEPAAETITKMNESLDRIKESAEKANHEVVCEGAAVAGEPGYIHGTYGGPHQDQSTDAATEPEPEIKVRMIPDDKAVIPKTHKVAGLQDGGTRQVFGAGAKKEDSSKTEGKGAYHLLPATPIRRVAEIYRKGAIKYDPRNWEKGIPLSRLLDSAMRHLFQFGPEAKVDEDHLHQAIWNLFALSETIERINQGVLPATLSDLPGFDIPGRRPPGPALELDTKDDQGKDKAHLKGCPEEEVFGKTIAKYDRFIMFMEGDKPSE